MVKGSPWDTMAAWVRQYGTICQFHLFGSDAICLADPELLKIVLQTKLHSFQKDVEWTYRPFMVLLGSGIVTSEGDSWFHQRKLLAAYMKTEVLDLIPDVTFRTTQRFIKKLEKVVEAKGTIEMAEEFRHLTLQIIGEAVLSLSPEECDATFAEMYLPIVTEGNLRTWDPTREYLPTPAWFKFQADVKRLNDYVTKLVVDRWNERKRLAAQGKCREKMDMLDKILDSLTDADWTQPTIDQVRDEIKTFVLAGHETTASMLAWTFYELSIDHGRDYADRVVSEAREAYGNLVQPDGNISKLPERAQLDKLFFTECCLREAIRKSSNVPTVVRMAVEDVQVGDYFFPRGTTVMVCMQGVHHNPAVWPDPLNYKPDRFKEKPKPFTFIPFLEGPRSCLGQYQALLESKLMLSILFSRFKFEAVDPVVAGERHPFMVPIIPKTGQYMRVTNRK
eukprot:scaffold7822_cov179-Ochromonas_danica.AAC.17